MKEICVEAINLRTHKLNGYKLLVVFSRQHGLLRLTGSKLGGRSENFVHNQYWISWKGEEIHRIRQTEFQEGFTHISEELDRLTSAWQFCEAVELCAYPNEESSEAIFELLLSSLRSLNSGDVNLDRLNLRFLWNLTSLLGYRPYLNLCSRDSSGCSLRCNQEVQAWFDLEQGGILCEDCLERGLPKERVNILPNIYKLLCELEEHGNLNSSSANTSSIKFTIALMQRHLQSHTDRKFKTYAFSEL